MFLTKKKSGSHCYLYLAKTLPKKENIWHRFKRKRAESPDNIDKIFIACGLKPLKYINTMGDVKIRLGLKSVSPDLMVAPEHVRYLQELSAAG